ncbi:ATP-binding protein [Streptomyces specialis]|uniref:ATP-binding protein n=1 Tax=Streptomyces specialis TaxID=498367 RepID=UPI00073E356B|nr:tetratricopeptide repeat protein [Streptomyces specialis]
MSGTARHVVQAGNVTGDIHFHDGRRPGGRPDEPTPRQLPGDVVGFVNREGELRQLDAVLAGEAGDRLVLSVLIAGTAGVGKTSLAVRWAHQAREHFPDGQLYVNLRGHDPGEPLTAQEALHHFLTALHVPARAIPADPEARAALYRSCLAGRKMLIVLDNAATVSQVRPLLPGSPGCLAIVTSRSRLSGLVVRDGARRITLGVLPEPEAVALLRAVTADYRPADDESRLVELARLCARLPLALRIAAERAASRPRMRLDDLIGALRDESHLWEALSAEDDEEADAVRTVFAWSYRALPQDAAALFRALGLHPGSAFHTSAAAALAAMPVSRTRQLLDVLVGAHLLEQTGPERYEFHDLLRAYAADQAQSELSDDERASALHRVLDWYLHTSDAAQTRVNPQEQHVALDPPGQGVTPLEFTDYADAAQWYEQERRNLLAAVRAAEAAGLDRIAWQLPAVLRGVQMRLNPFEEWLAMGEIGLRAARRLGDRAGEADLLESLGMVRTQTGRLDEAGQYHEACLAIRRELGDRVNEALSLNDIGLLRLRQRRLDEAASLFGDALALLDELTAGQEWLAVVRSNMAEVAYERGALSEARTHAHEALSQYAAREDERGQGNVLRILAAVEREDGRPEKALDHARRAVDIARSHRNQSWEGYWLLELGAAQVANGQVHEALETFHRSAVIQRRLGDRPREAAAWHRAGEAYRETGRHEEAADFHRNAATAYAALGDGWHRANALHGLALAQRASDEGDKARETWSEALRALTGYDDARATRLRERISEALNGG